MTDIFFFIFARNIVKIFVFGIVNEVKPNKIKEL